MLLRGICILVASCALAVTSVTPVLSDALVVAFRGQDGTPVEHRFSLDDLRAFDQQHIRTGNDFVDGQVSFRGPLAKSVLQMAGAPAVGTARLTAANDYSVVLDLADFSDYHVIFALEADGKPLSRRDKGPIWLMYPIDDNPELQVPATNARLIWQLVRLDIE